MECKKENSRHIFLFYFRKGNGEEAPKDRQCRNWFDKFRSGDFSLKDEQRSDWPNVIDDDQIKAIIESDRHVTFSNVSRI